MPWGFVVDEHVLLLWTPAAALSADQQGRRYALMPAVLMLLALLVVSMTTVTISLTIGRAEELGVLKTFGARGTVVRREMALEMAVTVVLGTLIGLGALLALGRWWAPMGGGATPWWTVAILWVPLSAALCAWAGHTARTLYDTVEPRALLNRPAQYDWWALVRVDFTQPLR